jgi:hypothetical protein
MRISLHSGVWVGSIGLWFTGGLAVTGATLPSQITMMHIGEAAILAGVLLFLWGIKWDGKHWWEHRSSQSTEISLSNAFRHLGHGSKWSITVNPMGSANWKNDADGEIRNRLRRGDIIAWATENTVGEIHYGKNPIPTEEWETIHLPDVIIDRGIDFAVMTLKHGQYHNLTLDARAVYKIWPKWSFITMLWRKWFDNPKSFAERSGDLATWHRFNQERLNDD